MKRTKYDKQFKIAAVKITAESNISIKEVAKELNISTKRLLQ